MVEVFKTNVENYNQSRMLIDCIHRVFTGYQANFDLDDCDKVLRVECITGHIQPSWLIKFLFEMGFNAEVLPDEPPGE